MGYVRSVTARGKATSFIPRKGKSAFRGLTDTEEALKRDYHKKGHLGKDGLSNVLLHWLNQGNVRKPGGWKRSGRVANALRMTGYSSGEERGNLLRASRGGPINPGRRGVGQISTDLKVDKKARRGLSERL